MTEQTKHLLALASQLPPMERIALVEELLAGLDQPDAAIEREWAEEAESRLQAYRRGEISAVGVEHLLAKYSAVAIRDL